MEQHKTILFNGHKIHFRDEGNPSRPTIVLLHGFLQSLEVWSSYLLHFMRELRVITIDLPGHGYSDTWGEVCTMEEMSDAVLEVLRQRGVDQCVMVGHSLGGYVALAFADRHPYYLRGLGLLHSHAMADSPEHRQGRMEACRQAAANSAEYVLGFIPSLFDDSRRKALELEIRELKEQCLLTSAEAIIATQRGMAERPSRLHVLARLEVPILFVYGKNDRRLPVELGLSQALEARYAEIMLLDQVAHMAHFEERDYVRHRLRNFIDTCYL